MASNKRKQDERHLKMLREMVSLPNNKQCFDCHQKGPTYINMTTGSYVCTSCSGILRGLNPPHRVKSISMASFSPDEMDFMKTHGNDFCRKVWLGLYDSRSMPEPDSREEQRVKDFMVQKYEKKRWYVAPTDGMKEEARKQNELVLANLNAKSTRPLKSMLGSENSPKLAVPGHQASHANAVPPPVTAQRVVNAQSAAGALHTPTPGQPAPTPAPQSQPPPTQPRQSATMDLLGDLGGDPFANQGTAVSAPPPQTSTVQGGGFADFANFNSQPAMSTPAFSTQSTASPLQPMGAVPSQPAPAANVSSGFGAFGAPTTQSQPQNISMGGGGDKYAALADLSSVFSSSPSNSGATQMPASSGPVGVNWSGGGSNSGPVSWGGAPGGGTVNWDNPGTTPGGVGGVSSAGGWNPAGQSANAANSGFPTTTTAANPFGARPSGVQQQQQQPPPQMAGNPFAGGGGAGGFAQFPSNPPPNQQAGFAQFGMPGQQPPVSAATGGFGGMQNGGFGMMPPGGSAQGGFGFPQAGGANMPAGQFGKPAAAAGGFGAPAQPFGGAGGWGNPAPNPTSNPFMSAAAQQAPPRTNATNPFL